MRILTTLLYLYLFSLCYSCDHDDQDYELHYLELPQVPQGRMLGPKERQNIRIVPFFELSWATEEVASKIRDHMIPAVISYFHKTLKVDPLLTNLVLSPFQLQQCEVKFAPKNISTEGVSADYVVFITGDLTNNAAMANSRAYFLEQTTHRPLAGKLNYNRLKNWEGMDDYTYELHLITTLHEFVHILGFSKNLYDYYINPETGRLIGYAASKIHANDIEIFALKTPPVKNRVASYFNCPDIEGAYLENQGTTMNTGSHFERRVFYNELMTAASIEDRRITEFSLAALEGTGWYTPDYSMAEPMFWGKGAGCSFFREKCINENQKSRFSEFFCDKRGEVGCTFTGESKGVCGAAVIQTDKKMKSAFDYFKDQISSGDPFADNCPYYKTVNHLSCGNPGNQGSSLIAGETFGEGSMCFSGTLSDVAELPFPMLYCMKKTCEEQTPGKFVLGIEVEGTKYYCPDGGSIEIKGYKGRLDCPTSINEYCSTKALKYCKRGCMGRGVCKNGECICDPGFEGPGCSIKVDPNRPRPQPQSQSQSGSTNGSNSQSEDSAQENSLNKTEKKPTTLVSSGDPEENVPSVDLLAVAVGVGIALAVVFVVIKVKYGKGNKNKEVYEEEAQLKSPDKINKTEDNDSKIIEIETNGEFVEKESQPNQEDANRESSSDQGDNEVPKNRTKEAPSAAFGNEKAKYIEL